ncbi:uncharacterized protein LOC114952699 [Acropora millepora]|uniref:uncharacterized protein LOC114952699 n=2 Tax=Acropora TaxID=6127 RepID=UPI001CF10B07|nr:uncharacterized protein LOC114952699 [Acropora millepora]
MEYRCRSVSDMTFECMIFLFLISVASAADSAGQKAHFQVEDKSGDLQIQATKDLAKVTAQADSVQVVVKPGTAEYPVLKSDKPIVHITQPGWHTMCFRKSNISKLKTLVARKAKRKTKSKIPEEKLHRIWHKKFKAKLHRRKSSLKKNSLDISRVVPKEETSHLLVLPHEKQEISGSKKSDVKFSGFHVSGDAGKIKMHVTKDETTLSSESGGVDISLNKSPPASSDSPSKASKKQQFQAQSSTLREEPSDKLIHIASESNDEPFIGLRKSIVGKVQDMKTKRVDWD